MMHFSRLAAVAAAALTVACGGGDSNTSPAPSPEPAEFAIVHATPSIRFSPDSITLTVGGTVDFDFQAVPHNLYFDNAPAGAPANITAPTTNATVSRTFSAAGRYAYNCHLHPGMSGVIVVR